jgi:hypothetical protein
MGISMEEGPLDDLWAFDTAAKCVAKRVHIVRIGPIDRLIAKLRTHENKMKQDVDLRDGEHGRGGRAEQALLPPDGNKGLNAMQCL